MPRRRSRRPSRDVPGRLQHELVTRALLDDLQPASLPGRRASAASRVDFRRARSSRDLDHDPGTGVERQRRDPVERRAAFPSQVPVGRATEHHDERQRIARSTARLRPHPRGAPGERRPRRASAPSASPPPSSGRSRARRAPAARLRGRRRRRARLRPGSSRPRANACTMRSTLGVLGRRALCVARRPAHLHGELARHVLGQQAVLVAKLDAGDAPFAGCRAAARA